MLHRELPTGLVIAILIVVVAVIGFIGWQVFRSKERHPASPEEARELSRLIERRIQQAGEGKVPEGMKPVPSPYGQSERR